MELPTFEVSGLKLIKRLTLIIKDGVVRKCFYPVFPPDRGEDTIRALKHASVPGDRQGVKDESPL